MSDFVVKDGQTILFIGDSITDCGRRGAEAPLGNGYVRIVEGTDSLPRRVAGIVIRVQNEVSLNQFAGKNQVMVIRDRNGSGPIEFRFNYDRFIKGKNLEQNILLLPGDRIVIPPENPFPW